MTRGCEGSVDVRVDVGAHVDVYVDVDVDVPVDVMAHDRQDRIDPSHANIWYHDTTSNRTNIANFTSMSAPSFFALRTAPTTRGGNDPSPEIDSNSHALLLDGP